MNNSSDKGRFATNETPALIPRMLNHAAFVSYDAAATVDFYEGILGMDLVHTVLDDRIPSTGDPFPYLHMFFRMSDGSTLAFFEAPGLPKAAPPSHPAHEIFTHFAFHAASQDELHRWKAHLEKKGVDVLGPVDHDGAFLSIYFHDPNGVRLEFTHPNADDWNDQARGAHEDLKRWKEIKASAKRDGRNVETALIEHIRDVRAQMRTTKAAV